MSDFVKITFPDSSITYYRIDSIKMIEAVDADNARIQFEDGKILLIPRTLLTTAVIVPALDVLNAVKA